MKLGLRRSLLACASLLGCALWLILLPVASSALAAELRASHAHHLARTCDAYGAGYFTLPGTDVCLRAGGMVVEDLALRRVPLSAFTPNPGLACRPRSPKRRRLRLSAAAAASARPLRRG